MSQDGEAIPRWSNHPFPPYTYVPGKSAHPIRDPAGHSFARAEPVVASFDPSRWDRCPTYLFGIDLFNAKFYWESHEQWEAVWHAVGRSGDVADFLKGLIKLSAAGVKSLEGRPIGVSRHLRRAADLFEGVHAQQSHETEIRLCGLVVSDLASKSMKAAEAIESMAQDETGDDVSNQWTSVFDEFRIMPVPTD